MLPCTYCQYGRKQWRHSLDHLKHFESRIQFHIERKSAQQQNETERNKTKQQTVRFCGKLCKFWPYLRPGIYRFIKFFFCCEFGLCCVFAFIFSPKYYQTKCLNEPIFSLPIYLFKCVCIHSRMHVIRK